MGKAAVLKVDIVADAKGVGKGVRDADQQLSGLGRVARKAGKAVALGIGGAVLAVGAFAASSIGAASSVEQSMGAVESVFGKAADQVKGYAGTAASQLGLARGEYASLAAVVGSQLQGMGKSQAESATATDALIRKGADLAATFGGSVSDAVGAVGSLLRGERDPIEKYGVSITAADVAARLAANGQDKLTGAALKTAQANATLALLTDKTKNATGAFGRESNTLAGQQERLRAQFENVKATVGAGLTPVLTSLLTFVTTTALPRLQQMGSYLAATLGPAFAKVGALVKDPVLPTLGQLKTFLEQNTGALKIVGTTLAVVGAAMLVYKTTVGVLTVATKAQTAVQTALNVAMRLNPIGLVVTAIAALGAGLVLAYNRSETFRDGVNALFGFLKRLVGFTPLGALLGNLDAVGRAVARVREAIGGLLSAAGKVGGVIGKLNPFSAPLAGMGVPLVGGVDLAPQSSRLATAAFGSPDSPGLVASGRAAGFGGVVVVDRRTIDARSYVEAMLLDDRAVARLERAQRDYATRLGASPAYGLA